MSATESRPSRIGRRAGSAAAYVPLLLVALVVIYPLALMLVDSLKTQYEIFSRPNDLPLVPQFTNYVRAWQEANFGTYFLNSVIVTVASVALTLLFASMAAYVLGRTRLPGRTLVHVFFLLGLMLPIRLAIVPLFVLFRDLQLLDTLQGLVIVYVASGLPFAVFLLTAFVRSIPSDLDDAASIDGAGDFTIYRRIVLPLLTPGLAVVGIYSTVLVWNDYFFPLIFIRSPDLRTLPLGVTVFFGEHTTEWQLVFAGLSITAIPLVAMFIALNGQFVKSLAAGAFR